MSFTCPRCHSKIRASAGGFCRRCGSYTLCAASLITTALFATGALELRSWPYSCAEPGAEPWRVTLPDGDGTQVNVAFCTAHGNTLRVGAANWMQGQGLNLERADA
jgi:hypothetical protein